MNAAVRGVIFDFDGLILDTEDADRIAWCEEFARAGVPITAAKYAGYWHEWSWHRKVRMIHRLAAALGHDVDEEEILAHRAARHRHLCADLPARPGISQWMAQARQLGLRVGVATNDDTGRATHHLNRLGLNQYLDAVITLQPGMARKPAPDLYLRALDKLGLDAGEVVAVEDSSHGIHAAAHAGIRTIAYPTPVSIHTDLTTANLIIDCAQRTTLPDALAQLAATEPTR